jgi:hypothetical protein
MGEQACFLFDVSVRVSYTHLHIYTLRVSCVYIFTELNAPIRSRVKIEFQCVQLVLESLLGPVIRVLNNALCDSQCPLTGDSVDS